MKKDAMTASMNVDCLIDDVARSITDVDVPSGLRARVLGRIGRERRTLRIWLLAPASLLATVALVVGWHGFSTGGPAPEPPVALVGSSQVGVGPMPPPGSPGAPVGTRESPRAATPRLEVRSIPALAEPRVLTVDGIQPDALAIPLLLMTPIATEPIGIRAIDDGSGLGTRHSALGTRDLRLVTCDL
jgi:hypothetical protein